MIIAHNTFTYMWPEQWWLRPFAWMAQCQNEDYVTLHEQYGVEGFDVRVWYRPNQTLEFRHGMFRYDGFDILKFLSYCSNRHLTVRLMLECRSKRMQREAQLRGYERRFVADCALWQRVYPGIRFYGGRNMYTWEVLFDFDSAAPVEFEYHSSVDGKKWRHKLNDLWPWMWTWIRSRSNKHRFIPSDGKHIVNDAPGASYAMLLDFCQMWNHNS